MNDKKRATGISLVVYIALGAAIGAVIGFAADRDNLALWVAVGVAIGLAIGTSRGAGRASNAPDDEEGSRPKSLPNDTTEE